MNKINILKIAAIFFPLLAVSVFADESLMRQELKVALPFASRPDLERGSIDFPVIDPGPIVRADGFLVEFECRPPEAARRMSLYFQSGDGWYCYGKEISNTDANRDGRFRIPVFHTSRSGIKTDGNPDPPEKIRTIRFSLWKGKSVDGDAVLHDIRTFYHQTVVVLPDGDGNYRPAKPFLARMDREEMPYAVVSPEDFSGERLQTTKTVVLPDVPLDPATVEKIREFLERGGRLIAFRQLAKPLREALDRKRGRGVFATETSGDSRAAEDVFSEAVLNHLDPLSRHRNILRLWEAVCNVGDTRTRTVSERDALESELLVDLKRRGFDLSSEFFREQGDDSAIHSIEPRFPELTKTLQEMQRERILRYCKSIPSRTSEFRAWWDSNGIGLHPGDWDRTMRELSEAGFTAVFQLVLCGQEVRYASDFLGKNIMYEKYGDQVEQAVRAGKKYGVQVHAWKINYRMHARESNPLELIEKMTREGRVQKDRHGKVLNWLCPSHPENIERECESMCEVVQKYDVDGIHFDYIRYLSSEYCYCEGCRDRYVKETGNAVADWPRDVLDPKTQQKPFLKWRSEQITKLVERVHREAKKIRSGVKISAAVFSEYPACRDNVGQDWSRWVEKGYLDFICPMDYTRNLNHFESLVERQRRLIDDRIPLYPGIGAWNEYDMPDQVAAQIGVVRQLNIPGFVFFELTPKVVQRIDPLLKSGVFAKE